MLWSDFISMSINVRFTINDKQLVLVFITTPLHYLYNKLMDFKGSSGAL